MTAAAQKEIVQKALALPKKARENLVLRLHKSLEESAGRISRKEWNRAWKAELEKRITDIDTGKVKCVPYTEVRKKLDRILGKA
jgi:putative addiction module component (TIGR02574 family)